MTQDIHAKIDALNSQVDYSDPGTYMDLLGYGSEGTDGGAGQDAGATGNASANQGDTAPANAAAAAPAGGQPTDAGAAASVPGGADSSDTPDAADSGATAPEAIDGIATRDGKRIIPYAVLQAERRDKQALQAQVQELQTQLQAKAGAASSEAGDLADRAATDPNSLTDAELEQLEQDFPSLAKPLRMIRALEEKVNQPPASTPPPPQASAQQLSREDEQAAYDQGIADNPLLASWMSEGGRQWDRAVAIDALLSQDPENKALTYSQRFAKVQAMVAAEFGQQLPAAPRAAPTQTTKSAPAAPQVSETLPTLTDLGGSGVSVSKDPLAGMTTGQQVDAAMAMSEEQLRAMVGLSF